jgi:hypothetical protein
MQANAADRDDRPSDNARQNPASDDAGAPDIFDLWVDLGGSD